MRVLIIPEDFRTDQYILKPVVTAMLRHVGKPRAKVIVCTDPVLAGVDQALKWHRLEEIIEMHEMVDLFLLLVDRDGVATRRGVLDQLEQRAQEILDEDRHFIAENAWQEIEVWALAGQNLPTDWKWRDVRTEPHPKESYFLPYAERRGLLDEPGQGRKTLGTEAGRRYARVRNRCPEDIGRLEQRLRVL